jgi:hypothetical protein
MGRFNSSLIILALSSLLMFAGCSCSDVGDSTTEVAPNTRTVKVTVDDLAQAMGDDVRGEILQWYMTDFSRTLLAVIHRYPIEALREEAHSFIHPDEGEPPNVVLIVGRQPSTSNIFDAYAFAQINEDGEKIIGFVAENLHPIWLEFEDEPETFEDLLIALIVHEAFHHREQGIEMALGDLDPEARARREKEAFHDTAHVLGAMQHGGRETFSTSVYAAVPLWTHIMGGCDLEHEAWVELGKVQSGQENHWQELYDSHQEQRTGSHQ